MRFTIKELVVAVAIILLFTILPLFFTIADPNNGLLGLAFVFFPLSCAAIFLSYGLLGGKNASLLLLPALGVLFATYTYFKANTSFLPYSFIYTGIALLSMAFGLAIHLLVKKFSHK